MVLPTDLFPHATDAALKTVEAHQDPQDLVFYAAWFCPSAQRSWITLEEKGIPYQYKEVNPYKKEKHFLDINPKGLVPAVEHQGKALFESLVLCEFFEDAYPTHEPRILPEDPYEKAYARIWIDFVAKALVPGFMRLFMAQGTEKQDAARAELYDSLRTFSAQIKGPYFLGEQFSLVDIVIAPWVTRDVIAAEHRAYNRGDVAAEWKQYAGRVEVRESVLGTKSNPEQYVDVYAPYLKDEAQSEAAKAIRAGRVIP
ncbi:glutathione-S-transferase [Roridomyces roridus]|uniref:Glutathione-S-transferase n=1 Tax=Roridomyces roridus TaxID=1738132 RepID=A0AAD7BD43_9AGAR|nr:glutathione-S-transferase [Roridomyces roridus]